MEIDSNTESEDIFTSNQIPSRKKVGGKLIFSNLNQIKNAVKCKHCLKDVSRRNKSRHEKHYCIKNNNRKIRVLLCAKCGAEFLRIDHLKMHDFKCNGDNTQNTPKCKHCLKEVSRGNKSRHERYCIKNNNTKRVLLCAKCGAKFLRLDNLKMHDIKCNGVCRHKSKCMYRDCSESFPNKNVLVEHLSKAHGCKIKQPVIIHFKSFSDFQIWKKEEETRSLSYFSQHSGTNRGKTYYYCQHDGSSRPHRKLNEPARKTKRRKLIGSIKKDKTCIAMMHSLVRDDGSCIVKYYETHSHPLTVSDVMHQPGRRSKKVTNLRTPTSTILNNVETPSTMLNYIETPASTIFSDIENPTSTILNSIDTHTSSRDEKIRSIKESLMTLGNLFESDNIPDGLINLVHNSTISLIRECEAINVIPNERIAPKLSLANEKLQIEASQVKTLLETPKRTKMNVDVSPSERMDIKEGIFNELNKNSDSTLDLLSDDDSTIIIIVQ